VTFVGLTAEGADAKDDTQAFLDDFKISWSNGYGAGETIEALGVRGYPTVFVIGRDGKIAWNDELPGTLEEAISKALGTDAA
jgi:hypothetical protein